MRRLSIDHVTEYRFRAQVTLLEHRLLLRPREDHCLRIASSRLDVAPTAVLRWQRDALGNSVAIASFAAVADCLRISSAVVIEQYDEDPLDFVVEQRAVSHPFAYEADEAVLLMPFMAPSWPADQAAVRGWLGDLGVAGAPLETFVLLERLNTAIHLGLRYEAREEQGVQSPAHTLSRRAGSCRDFAALFVDACRHLGVASRFVSGYLHSAAGWASPGQGATHAWAEVYLPGPGWKGFDPTCGQLAGADHIAVAVAREAQAVPPVAGAFIGDVGPTPHLQVTVRVRLS